MNFENNFRMISAISVPPSLRTRLPIESKILLKIAYLYIFFLATTAKTHLFTTNLIILLDIYNEFYCVVKYNVCVAKYISKKVEDKCNR